MGCREKSHALRAAPFGKGSLPKKYGFHYHIKFGLRDHAVHVLSRFFEIGKKIGYK